MLVTKAPDDPTVDEAVIPDAIPASEASGEEESPEQDSRAPKGTRDLSDIEQLLNR